ncbi:MAG: long-chain fatty acid--CoA ligase [Propionicimonas sp.]|uniref:AMP-dependent synthetase/ligase n=1 Tax=Propionicimonas sp. TaxID=1955623 RepID=UPI003D13F0F1
MGASTIDADALVASAPPSAGALFRWRVEQTPKKEAFRYPDATETWVSIDWTETRRRVDEYAAGLLAIGLKPEERVAISSNTRIEWILTDYAINCAGGATTTIYPNTQGKDFAHIVTDSGSVVLIAENAEQVAKLDESAEASAQVHHVVLFDGEGDGERVLSLAQLAERGRALLASDPGAVDRAIAAIGIDHLATLIYTSGTTGLPKGVELTHRCWVYQAVVLREMELISPSALQYLWLPLSHVFGKDLLTIQLGIGFSTAVDGRIDHIVSGLGEVHPNFMCGAPRIFEKVRAAVLLSSPQDGLKGRIARWAFAVGRASREYRLADKPLPVAMRLAYSIADRLVFSKLKDRVGGNVDFFVSGSAKLSSQVQAWFYSAGLMVVEGYGLTETGAVTCVNLPLPIRFGTVGPALVGTEVKIAEDGEILIKGPAVMRGYHNDPERTAEVLVDGWFHSGDIGKLDADGFLTITDRKKDLMKTSGGKYVAPAKVEGVIAASVPYVSQVVAVGDGRKYISALLTMDRDNLAKWAARHDMADRDYAEITQSPELRKTIERFMGAANGKLERWETVKRFAILPAELSVDDGGVTPNMKIRRKVVTEQYAEVVESLYDEEPVDSE